MSNSKDFLKHNYMQYVVTLAVHVVLFLDAAVSISDYTDFFLGSALVLLIVYLIFVLITSIERGISRYLLILFYACTLVQIAVLDTGIIDLGSHPLGGGGLGAVFYEIGLIIFCIILGIITWIKWIMMRAVQKKKD